MVVEGQLRQTTGHRRRELESAAQKNFELFLLLNCKSIRSITCPHGWVIVFRGQSFSTYTRKGEGGRAKRLTFVQRGRRVMIFMFVGKIKIPFCMYYVIFLYVGYFYHTLLSLATTFNSF